MREWLKKKYELATIKYIDQSAEDTSRPKEIEFKLEIGIVEVVGILAIVALFWARARLG